MIPMMWLALPALAAPVGLTSADGSHLSAERYGSGKRGVLLVHDEARSRADWGTLGPRLASAGYLVLAVDLRGHGASKLATPLAEADWPKLVGDVKSGIDWLGAQGATELHVVGAGFGANLALVAAADPRVTDLVLLSPTLSAHGVRVSTAIGPFGKRPLLVVASRDDALALKAATWVEQQAVGPKELATYTGAGSGARMLATAPDLEGRIVGWLASAGRPAGGDAVLPSKAPELVPTEVGAIRTTGTRLEDRER
jgi:pimeloyl-ACP methyl ester carboxylesterase